MDEQKDKYITGDELRRRAEELLGKNRETTHIIGVEDVQKVLHELQVHQVELEMQNAELLRTRDHLEVMLEKYSDLFDFAPVGYLSLKRDGTILSVNFTGASFLGSDRPLLLGRRFGMFVTEEYRSVFAAFLDMVFISKDNKSCEVALVKKDRNVPLIVQVEARSDEAGKECRLALVDITERKRAEQALQESERIYRAIGESIDYGVWICDPDGRNTYASDSFLNLVGISQEQCSNFGWGAVLHPDDAESTIEAWKKSVRVGENWDREHRFLGVDGQWHPILARGVPVRDDQGNITCWAGINLDISRIKEAENKLRENEERHRLLAETMLQGVVHQDAKGTIISMNPAAERILGKSREEFLGSTSITEEHDTIRENGEIFPGMEHPAMVALQTGQPVQGVVMGVFNPRLDKYRWININAVPVFRSNNTRPSEVYAVFEDITERKQAEEALNKLNEELENRVAERTAELRNKDEMLLMQSRQAAMGEMIGNIAHQWRQPLNTLGLTIQSLLLFYDLGGFSREFLDESVNTSMGLIQHMSKTVDDFRNYFKPDKKKVEFKLSETISKTLSLVEDSFKMQSISIEVIAKMDPVINGYQNELAQAILNILNNARDALVEKEIKDPRVTITIFTENGRSVVTISDNAGGIPEEFFEKIFDPYFTTKGPQAGTGIGLFMSKSIIEKSMNGSLVARNTASGAEFRIEV